MGTASKTTLEGSGLVEKFHGGHLPEPGACPATASGRASQQRVGPCLHVGKILQNTSPGGRKDTFSKAGDSETRKGSAQKQPRRAWAALPELPGNSEGRGLGASLRLGIALHSS